MKYVGIDEVGRGPLAGPVVVGVVRGSRGVDEYIPGVADSKKLSAKKREAVYEQALVLRDQGVISFSFQWGSPEAIDAKGIAVVLRDCVAQGLADLDIQDEQVLLDGALHAPNAYTQETIIGGDGKEPLISLASVLAKVERDRYMESLDAVYPVYGLGKHKGYGTEAHREAISLHGPSPVHRVSFCRNILHFS